MTEECKRLLFKVAIKNGVSPRLISTKLLSEDDKRDMLRGEVLFDTLDTAVRLWKENGFCNYSNGSLDI